MTTNKDYLNEAIEIAKGNTKIKQNKYHIVVLYKSWDRLREFVENSAHNGNALLQDMGI